MSIKTDTFLSEAVIYQDGNATMKCTISFIAWTLIDGKVFKLDITVSFHPCLLQPDAHSVKI